MKKDSRTWFINWKHGKIKFLKDYFKKLWYALINSKKGLTDYDKTDSIELYHLYVKEKRCLSPKGDAKQNLIDYLGSDNERFNYLVNYVSDYKDFSTEILESFKNSNYSRLPFESSPRENIEVEDITNEDGINSIIPKEMVEHFGREFEQNLKITKKASKVLENSKSINEIIENKNK